MTPEGEAALASVGARSVVAADPPMLLEEAVAAGAESEGAEVRLRKVAELAAYLKDQEAGVSELVKSGLLKPE